MEERTMYVIQRDDGKFYYKYLPGYYRFGSFEEAHLFSSEKGAKTRISTLGRDGQECKVKQIKVTLVD